MASGAVITAYIMKRYFTSPSASNPSDITERKSSSSSYHRRGRRSSSICGSIESDSDDQVAPLEKMQKRLSIGYVPATRRSILLGLSDEDHNNGRRSPSPRPRRLYSSLTRDSGIESRDSITSSGETDCDEIKPHFSLQRRRRSHSLDDFLANSVEATKTKSHVRHTSEISVVTREESYISETEMQFKGEEEFGDLILQSVKSLPDSLRLLRRTRAISALASRLMEAHNEEECIEEVSRLLALMFDLKRVSFGMVTGTDHFTIKRVMIKRNIEKGDSLASFELDVMDSDFKRPLAGTACGVACETRREHYAPRTNESPFETHKALYNIGYKTTLTSPILVNGRKCAGAILVPREEEDGFSKQDRVLISDIAAILGSNIYSKRLRKATEESNKLSRQILHSFVPEKVLEKIECYWGSGKPSPDLSIRSMGLNDDDGEPNVGSNAWYVASFDWTEGKLLGDAKIVDKKFSDERPDRGRNEVQSKLQLLRNLNRTDDDSGEDVGVVVQASGPGIDFSSPTRALYAENAKNVCIVFTDIVGFSRISMDIAPIKVMDMLQNLFNRFDELCDLHGVMKLETIGDAYICATNLLQDDDVDGDTNARDAAVRALEIAKDMICEARNVIIPCAEVVCGVRDAVFETLEIRVGIHCGDVTCGVLGQKMPKFTVCGTAVNMAARMEQTSLPSMIRATKDFHDLVGDAETNWLKREAIHLKNMGEMETYLLDPIPHIEVDLEGIKSCT